MEEVTHWQMDQSRSAVTAANMGSEWGSTYDANLNLARRAVAEVGAMI